MWVATMARRKTSSAKKALTNSQYNTAVSTIRTLKARVEHYMDKCGLTDMDILKMFVHEEDHVVLVRAKELTRDVPSYYRDDHFVVRWAHRGTATSSALNVSLDDPSFLLPHYIGTGIVANDPEVEAKINKWIDWNTQHENKFALLRAVVDDLNNYCDSLQQVRFYFRGIVTLLGDEALQAFKMPRELPDLPYELRQACNDMNALLARVMLYANPEGKAPQEPVTLMWNPSGRRVKPWPPFNPLERYMRGVM